MTWMRLNVDFADHPKLAGLPESTQFAWIRVLAWCQKHDTGGVVRAGVPFRTFTKHTPDQARDRLLETGALVDAGAGELVVPNFMEYQDTIRQRKKREGWRDAKARQRGSQSQNAGNVLQDVLPMSSDNATGRNQTGPDETSSSVRPKKHAGRSSRATTTNGLERVTASDFAGALRAADGRTREIDQETTYLEQLAATEHARAEDPA